MSKILIDEETLYAVIDALNIGYLISSGKEQQMIFDVRHKLLDDLQGLLDELQETKKRFSVLEWHHLTTAEEDGKMFWLDIPEIERCGKSKQVLVKDRHGVISAVNVDFEENQDDDGEWVSGVYPDGEDWFDYVAWAYLPE